MGILTRLPRRRLLAIAAGLLLAPAAGAGEPINRSRSGLALGGYDPVAYFTAAQPVRGEARFAHTHDGTTYHFASAANRDAFAADPGRYAPQYGGFCAWAVSRGYTADVDPQAWRIVDGKLYLNYSPRVRATWAEDIPGNIRRADGHWPGLRGKGGAR